MTLKLQIVAFLVFLSTYFSHNSVCGVSILTFFPNSSPVTGKTNVTVHGQGFMKTGSSRSKCHFRTARSSRVSPNTEVINSTYLYCDTPAVPFLDSSTAPSVVAYFSVSAGPSFSPSRLFIFFNLDRMTIKSMNPVEGGVATGGVVAIRGNEFVDTGEIVCLVDGARRAVGVFVNSTLLICNLPPVYPSIRSVVKISLNDGDASGIIPGNDSVTTFTFYHEAPQLLSATFSASLSEISLEFETEVEIGDEVEMNSRRQPDCKTILSHESYVLIGGKDASCNWATQHQRRVTIALPATASVFLGSTLTLRGGNVRVRWQLYSRLASGNATVSTRSDVKLPVAVIEGPSVVPACGNVTITARNSQAVGYAGLSYNWWLSSSSIDDPLNLSLQDVDTVELPSDWFSWDAEYVIHLRVSSPLGFDSEIANHTLRKANSSVPIVEILGPTERRILCSDDLLLESKVSVVTCASQTSILGYEWIVTQESGQRVSLDSIPGNTSTLFIPYGTLPCNQTYTVKFSVRSSDPAHARDRITDSPLVHIQTERQQLDARILGGNAWSISVLQELLLDGSLSLDPSSDGDNHAVYNWDCVVYNTTRPCVNASSGYVLTFPQDSSASIEPEYLQAGQSYVITLNYTNGRQFSTTQTVVSVTDEPEEVPVVGLVLPASSQSINPSEEVTIPAFISSHFVATAVWSCVSEIPGFGHVDLTDPTVVSTPSQYQLVSTLSLTGNEDVRQLLLITTDDDDLRSVYMTLRPGSLLPGIPYRFRLTVTNGFGSNFAEVTVKTSPIPSSCVVSVVPATGLAVETLFRVQAIGCVVESHRYPLTYRYGVKRKREEEIDWLGGETADSALATLLPVGDEESAFELSVYVRVKDRQDVHQTFSSTAVVNVSSSISLTSLEAQITGNIAANWQSALRSLQTVLSTINAMPSRFAAVDIASFKSSSVGILNQLYNTMHPRRKDTLVDVLSTLLQATEGNAITNAPHTTTGIVVGLIESSVTSIVDSQGEDQLEASLTAHEGAQVLNIYSNILPRDGERILRSEVTESLQWAIDKIGFAMCKQQTYGGVEESAVFGLGAVETSVFTPVGSHHVGCSLDTNSACPFNSSSNSMVDFDAILAGSYSTWSCSGDETCSGVCSVSAQITANLYQTVSPYDPVHKSDTVSLSLLDPMSGEELEVKDLAQPVVFDVRLTVSSERKGVIQCVYWDEEREAWSSFGCGTQIPPETNPLPVGFVVHCECRHLSLFLVIEQCPPGSYGYQCENTCPQGLWGVDCSSQCACSSRGSCDPVDGRCDCDSGWIGSSCDASCTDGYWGKNCSQACTCQNSAKCIPQNGQCECTEGWIGTNCSTSCAAGLYGLRCAERCVCQNDASCSAVTGECLCAPGYTGTDCSSECPPWTYGLMCQSNCQCHRNGSISCHHITGDCTCREKWNSTFCQTAIPEPVAASPAGFPAWTIGLALIIVLVVVAGILGFLYYRKRKRGKMVIHPVDEVDGQVEEEEDDEVTITKARSMEYILRTKPGTRERIEWEVAKVKETRRTKRKSVNVMQDEESQEPTIEVLPKKIRLPPNGTLADLREALMEENWFEEGVTMKFLLRGDQRLFYSQDQEPVVILAQVFVENGGFRMVHVLESKEVKRRRKKSRAVSGRQRNESMRRKAMRNASASSQATGSQASMSASSYSSYTSDDTYSESFTESEEDNSGSETERSGESAFEAGSETGSYTSHTRSHSESGSDKRSLSQGDDNVNDDAQPAEDRAASPSVSSQARQRSASPQTSDAVGESQLQGRQTPKNDGTSDDVVKPVEAIATTSEGRGDGETAESAMQDATLQATAISETPTAAVVESQNEEASAKDEPVEAGTPRADGESRD